MTDTKSTDGLASGTIEIECNIPVLALALCAIKKESVSGSAAANSLNLPEGDYVFEYDYPLEHGITRTHRLFPGSTGIGLLQRAARDYMNIYLDELESTKIPVKEVQNLGALELNNRNKTDGFHGIWGHVIDDLIFEHLLINVDQKVISFHMGS